MDWPTAAKSGDTDGYGIVVGVDGSPDSAAAVQWAAQEALLSGIPLTLLCVVAPTVVSWPMAPLQETVAECQRQNAEDALVHAREAVRSIAVEAGREIAVTTEVQYSPPVPALVDASKKAHMVVVGSRGIGRLAKLVLGSVSGGLVHHAHGPVTVVHTRDGRLPDPAAPVVLGIDGSPVSEQATAVAFDEAAARKVDLVAVHVWKDIAGPPLHGQVWDNQSRQAEEVLAERLAGWQERYPDVRVHRRVEFDDPARRLIDASRTAQLLVVGSHGRGGFAGMLLGSVGSAVVQSVDVPVTVVRPR
ncbi:universal stress protein [Mycobacterium sp. 4D054]|uniref:universal stress protein n=1 Tax=unclassified Mycobacterium TaxID=2642494 RepID=UPI0021B201E1|nr:universal stress protein [Mycobacterium sp. SMC-8]UXA14728.1 universal stress protein [Mycobacterium sp. SMC-8]